MGYLILYFYHVLRKFVKNLEKIKYILSLELVIKFFLMLYLSKQKKQQKKGSSLINANEGSIFKNSLYLTSKYEKFSDKLFKKIKTKEYFIQRHFLHKIY